MTKPDCENFAKAVLSDWPTGDLDGSVLFDFSLQYGMIQEVPGGYNHGHHIDADGRVGAVWCGGGVDCA